jgi:putative oxidoreductase
MRDITDLIGRIFLSAIFIYEAVDSILYFGKTKEIMTEYGLTWNQDLMLCVAIFLLSMGGLMVLVGYRTTLGAIMLLLYWVPVTLIVHDFWNSDTSLAMRYDSIFFMKNFAITGGLLMLIGKGSGRYSIRSLFATTRVH